MSNKMTFQLMDQIYSIEEITSSADLCFDQMKKLYEDSFPLKERVSIDSLLDRMEKRQERFFILKNLNEVIGIGFIADFSNPSFSFLDYFAIKKKSQNNGLGSAFLNNLLKLVSSDKNTSSCIILEVEDPAFAINKIEARRRIKFYHQCNFEILHKINYLIPDLSNLKKSTKFDIELSNPSQKLKLMFYHAQQNFRFTRTSLSAIIQAIYVAHYKISEYHPFIKVILDSIPEKNQ